LKSHHIAPQYELLHSEGVPIKAWVKGVPLELEAQKQLSNIAKLPFIYKWLAAMPDVHLGKGATVGSVIPTVGAIIPAAVGVDIGCGMMAARTTLKAKDLPTNLKKIREHLEKAIPHGRTFQGKRGDAGAWSQLPTPQKQAWGQLKPTYDTILAKHSHLDNGHVNHVSHLGTLGTGNHFIELCLDESDSLWILLHSGSRGVGNRIGTYFIELAKRDMGIHVKELPDQDLAYLKEGTQYFDDYVQAVSWAQEFARLNRELMMQAIIQVLQAESSLPPFQADLEVVNCHHNYVNREMHYGQNVLVTRKGAVSAKAGELGIIPGSMGARSYIVRGCGNEESFHSCSHGAGRKMSRGEAKRRFTLEDHCKATQGIECRKDALVLDETPGAYKDIDRVMAAQKDLVTIEHTLRQIVCIKG
jgi:tRNA-splicing ligase RtcB (3'-phosphate/5'-hydroxy nucleic acid ligase)